MTTLAKPIQSKHPVELTRKSSVGFWETMFKGDPEQYRFGIIPAVLIVVGCLGGVAAMGVLMTPIDNVMGLVIILIPTMAALSALLSVAPIKWLLNLSVAANVLDIIMIVLAFAFL